jgi:hypothetical protein
MAYVPRSFVVFSTRAVRFLGRMQVRISPQLVGTQAATWELGHTTLGKKKKKTVGILNCGFSKTVPGKKTGEWSVGSVD